MRRQMLWKVGQDDNFIVGYDEDMTEQARVKTGETVWTFNFVNFAGAGRVRLGIGCDYNPLQMIEAMWEHIAFGGLEPAAQVQFSENLTLPDWEEWA